MVQVEEKNTETMTYSLIRGSHETSGLPAAVSPMFCDHGRLDWWRN